jgi:hypothetical protein
MLVGLVSMMGNVGATLNSQGGGFGLIQTKMLWDNHPHDTVDVNPPPSTWGNYDLLYICEGVNFVEGSFNVPGGPQKLHTEKMKAIAEFKGELRYSNSIFDFNKFNKRLKVEGTFPETNTIAFYNTFLAHGLHNRKGVIGDSHALSVWKPGYSLDFTAGRTLHGFLKRNTPEVINEIFDETVTYFMNIDIRFHLMRQVNPKDATKDLIGRYIDFSRRLKNNTIVEPLPIEHQSRKIPGTGLYKKQPFFGTREERMDIRQIAIEMIRNSGQKYISWPEDWIDLDGTKMLDILESRQSVHLKPKYYPFLNEILGQ